MIKIFEVIDYQNWFNELTKKEQAQVLARLERIGGHKNEQEKNIKKARIFISRYSTITYS